MEDDVAVDAFITGGGTDRDNPEFLQPGEEPHCVPAPTSRGIRRTWPSPRAATRPRRTSSGPAQELERDGPAAIERTVP